MNLYQPFFVFLGSKAGYMIPSESIKKWATAVGFDLCGITPAAPLPWAEQAFRRWIAHGAQGPLDYLTRHTEKRFHAARLVDQARTVIVCAVSYKSPISEGYPPEHRAKIASYACNRDYHTTIKQMLLQLLQTIQQHYPTVTGRAFVDAVPLSEKSYAVAAGLGWIGRNSLLITPQYGSFIHLAELIINEEVDPYDQPFTESRCGSCRACIEHCPTGAIGEERTIDARHCIACRTIERADSSDEIDLHGWIFGCDSCQQACPYNQHAPLHRNPAFDPLVDPHSMTAEEWLLLNEEQFQARFGATPMPRAGLRRIQESITKP